MRQVAHLAVELRRYALDVGLWPLEWTPVIRTWAKDKGMLGRWYMKRIDGLPLTSPYHAVLAVKGCVCCALLRPAAV